MQSLSVLYGCCEILLVFYSMKTEERVSISHSSTPTTTSASWNGLAWRDAPCRRHCGLQSADTCSSPPTTRRRRRERTRRWRDDFRQLAGRSAACRKVGSSSRATLVVPRIIGAPSASFHAPRPSASRQYAGRFPRFPTSASTAHRFHGEIARRVRATSSCADTLTSTPRAA